MDFGLLHRLRDFFKCGSVHLDKGTNVGVWLVHGMRQLRASILPFFEEHPLKSKRNVEFKRFRKLCLRVKRINKMSANEIAELRQCVRNLHKDRDRHRSSIFGIFLHKCIKYKI
jgi:hypothetical protein